MINDSSNTQNNADLHNWLENFQTITTESNKVFSKFFADGGFNSLFKQSESSDPLNINTTFLKAYADLAKEPEVMAKAGVELYEKFSRLWVDSSNEFLQEKPAAQQEHYDRRFASADWHQLPAFKFIKEAYLTYADWLMQLTNNVDELDKKEQDKLEFYTRQFLDAVSPANFLWTNPEVLRATIETNGKNLAEGLKNLANDFANGKIGQTDFSSFELGKNLATTKGSVVFQNDLLQLIQYAPTTEKTFATPLLFIPAWINKFYIADLQPKNSLVKWLVEQGYSVFVVSWVNPDKNHSNKGFDAYITEGLLEAIDAIIRICKQPQVNCIGYCLGGTLLATTLSYLQEKNLNKINSATFLTTMLDFSDAGEISVFIDEPQIAALEKRMSANGYLEGSEMSLTFNMLRANDLIWSFVINNYLLGKTPFPFDILYWNSDSTRMPAKMHSFYLRNMYLKNLLAKKGGIEINGVKIDISKITNPAYFLSTKKDHIAPWETTYIGAKMLKNAKFTLADSGHVAGVVNPPTPAGKEAKYHHWEADKIAATPQEWLKTAQEVSGSWWPSWHEWNKQFSGALVPALSPKNEIEPAPGSYVKKQS
jgi:polyhydroxyalkanoate synthase